MNRSHECLTEADRFMPWESTGAVMFELGDVKVGPYSRLAVVAMLDADPRCFEGMRMYEAVAEVIDLRIKHAAELAVEEVEIEPSVVRPHLSLVEAV